MPWAVVGAVVGGVISADAADSAADAQSEAASNATALQKYIFDQQKEMYEPWRQAGLGGLNRLSYLMGISPTGYGGQGSMSSGGLETADQIRARLSGAYTTRAQGPITGYGDAEGGGLPQYGPETVTVDNARLDAAVQAEMARQQRELKQFQAQGTKASKNDPQYGSLLDEFGMDDFQEDPGYQFRLEQGQKALDRRLAAGGQFYSGRSLKDSMNYNQGMAAQEYGSAFDRFRLNQGDTFNRLASLAGIGQTATQQTSNAAGRYGEIAGGNMIGAGNALAAGRVGSANAWNNALGQGVSAFQGRNWGGGGGGWTPSQSYEPYAGNGGGAGNYNYGGGF